MNFFLALAEVSHSWGPVLQSIKTGIKVSSEYQQLCKISARYFTDKKADYSNPIKEIHRGPDTCFTSCHHKFSLLISQMVFCGSTELSLHLEVSWGGGGGVLTGRHTAASRGKTHLSNPADVVLGCTSQSCVALCTDGQLSVWWQHTIHTIHTILEWMTR